MDLMDRLRSGLSRSIKRLSISVSLKSLDSRVNIENHYVMQESKW